MPQPRPPRQAIWTPETKIRFSPSPQKPATVRLHMPGSGETQAPSPRTRPQAQQWLTSKQRARRIMPSEPKVCFAAQWIVSKMPRALGRLYQTAATIAIGMIAASIFGIVFLAAGVAFATSDDCTPGAGPFLMLLAELNRLVVTIVAYFHDEKVFGVHLVNLD